MVVKLVVVSFKKNNCIGSEKAFFKAVFQESLILTEIISL